MWIKLVKDCNSVAACLLSDMLKERGFDTRVVQASGVGLDVELDLSGLLSTAVKLAIVSGFNEFDSGANWASHMILETAKDWIEERNEK